MKNLLLFFVGIALLFIDFETLYFALTSSSKVEIFISIIVGLCVTVAGVLALPLFSMDKRSKMKKRYNY